ncbi:hypothetical protein DSM110093_01564 [Sulfitobacter sp. DSM 110093]|uniref:hypothetical protein n=1 Tax=Sulfitobacter sp. DSM 110093 TaxID=2883127 RepID=UPI001FAC1F35|nr:hypothetical protein [Sulfitobacter sp. DSM 110093]UOA31791.1 hypothetical protein DSM110093_01564 [Sulfitobacter sp. DSM 110093]
MKQIVNMVMRQVMRRMLSRAGKRRAGKGSAFNARSAQQGIRMLRRFFRSR